jgi:hypothetical protein
MFETLPLLFAGGRYLEDAWTAPFVAECNLRSSSG